MVTAIIFDMDGTITLTEHLHVEAFTTIFAEYGIAYDAMNHMKRFAGSGSPLIFKTVFAEHGKSLSEAELEDLIKMKRELYTKIVQSRPVPCVKGVQDFVKRIEAHGIKKIIATGNGDLNAVKYLLTKIGIGENFTELISISEVAHGKPFPDVFIAAAERLGTPITECIVLEDSVNGVLAAHAAGIKCIAFETTSKKEDLLAAGASLVVPDYTGITDAMLA